MEFKKIDKTEFKYLFPKSPNNELAKKYKVKESTIRVWGQKLRLKKNNWLWSTYHELFVLKYYKSKKYTILEIAQKLKRSRWSVINKYRELSSKRIKKRQ